MAYASPYRTVRATFSLVANTTYVIGASGSPDMNISTLTGWDTAYIVAYDIRNVYTLAGTLLISDDSNPENAAADVESAATATSLEPGGAPDISLGEKCATIWLRSAATVLVSVKLVCGEQHT